MDYHSGGVARKQVKGATQIRRFHFLNLLYAVLRPIKEREYYRPTEAKKVRCSLVPNEEITEETVLPGEAATGTSTW